MTYDELYGIDINEYCKRHNITVDDLIRKTEVDIEILKNNLHKQTYKEPTDWTLVGSINKLLNKKEAHLKRLKQWKRESEKCLN
jgi:hypothetical protein